MSLGAFGNANTQATSSEVAKRRETSEVQWILGDVCVVCTEILALLNIFSSLRNTARPKIEQTSLISLLVFGVSCAENVPFV